jgi:uncharacterized protein involved in type VI secretion and phage assembly
MDAKSNRLYGVYPARVANNVDPENQGRLQVQMPRFGKETEKDNSAWARLATLMAGKERGTWFIPDVGDEVLVAFEGGDPRRPYVIGALWNADQPPPESMDGGGKNNIKSIVSRQGIRITLDDSEGLETVTIRTPGGQEVVLKDQPPSILIQDSSNNQVSLEPAGIHISTSGKLSLSAAVVEISASLVSASAGMARFSGVVQADTIIANSVVSNSYTPGVGNVM